MNAFGAGIECIQTKHKVDHSVSGVLLTNSMGSSSITLLERVQSNAFRLINFHSLDFQFQTFSLHLSVCYFSLFHRYYFSFRFRKMSAGVPPPLVLSYAAADRTQNLPQLP